MSYSKTKSSGKRFLIVCPLGVRHEFVTEAHEKLGMEIKFIRRIEEAGETGVYLTNYETIRDEKLDPLQFVGASLDEASCLRGMCSGTKPTAPLFCGLPAWERVPYRAVLKGRKGLKPEELP